MSISPLTDLARRRYAQPMMTLRSEVDRGGVIVELYFAPLACSLVPRIVALETGAAITFRQVELFAKVFTDTGEAYCESAPLAQVPVLRLDDGELLTEVQSIVQYLADACPASGLMPALGTRERYRTLAWLAFGATELHKAILWVLANRHTPREAKLHAKQLAGPAFDHLDAHLAGREYIASDRFTVADAYFAWVFAVAPLLRIEIGDRLALRAYAQRLAARRSVREALELELSLLPDAMQRQAAAPARSTESSTESSRAASSSKTA
jgi:glutathione S-transferase